MAASVFLRGLEHVCCGCGDWGVGCNCLRPVVPRSFGQALASRSVSLRVAGNSPRATCEIATTESYGTIGGVLCRLIRSRFPIRR
jgi:hypothetical protein